MNDAKLYFSTRQLTAGADAVSDYYLDVKKIAEVGKGSQLFINLIIETSAQTYVPAAHSKLDVFLCTYTAAPANSSYRIMAVSVNAMNALTGGALLSDGLKVKVPLPSLNLLDHIGLWYQMDTGCSACYIKSFLTLT